MRFVTTQPTQALLMLNSEFLNAEAAVLADRLRREAGADVKKQVTLAMRLATARPAVEAEIHRGEELVTMLCSRDSLTP